MASARKLAPSSERANEATAPVGPAARRSDVCGKPWAPLEEICLSFGVMIVAAEAAGNTPPGARVTTFTDWDTCSVQATVTSPAGVVATRGPSEIRFVSD